MGSLDEPPLWQLRRADHQQQGIQLVVILFNCTFGLGTLIFTFVRSASSDQDDAALLQLLLIIWLMLELALFALFPSLLVTQLTRGEGGNLHAMQVLYIMFRVLLTALFALLTSLAHSQYHPLLESRLLLLFILTIVMGMHSLLSVVQIMV